MGIPLPPLAERTARLEETLQIAHQMWSEENKPYEGKYYHLAQTLNSPQPIQKPHPPILIGGHGWRTFKDTPSDTAETRIFNKTEPSDRIHSTLKAK